MSYNEQLLKRCCRLCFLLLFVCFHAPLICISIVKTFCFRILLLFCLQASPHLHHNKAYTKATASLLFRFSRINQSDSLACLFDFTLCSSSTNHLRVMFIHLIVSRSNCAPLFASTTFINDQPISFCLIVFDRATIVLDKPIIFNYSMSHDKGQYGLFTHQNALFDLLFWSPDAAFIALLRSHTNFPSNTKRSKHYTRDFEIIDGNISKYDACTLVLLVLCLFLYLCDCFFHLLFHVKEISVER